MTKEAERAADGEFGFVLAVQDRRHGLSFWRNEGGFGNLSSATVFSAAEAATFDVPIAEQPEWLAMPAPLGIGDRP